MEDRRAVGVAAASLYNSYTYYFGPRKGPTMTKEHDDLYDRYNCEGDREFPQSVRLLRGNEIRLCGPRHHGHGHARLPRMPWSQS